jgi:predicted Zn-dependent peptidase
VADVVLRPAFPEEEVRKALAQRIDGSKAAKDDPPRAALSGNQKTREGLTNAPRSLRGRATSDQKGIRPILTLTV